jgi:alkylation response protein AidB-like acyl-CoA dehydrogenase
MDLELSDEQRMLVEQVRRFVRQEVEPLEADLDPDASELSADDHERLVGITTGMGLYQMDVPEEFGGAGLDVMTRTLLAMEMSQHRAGLYAPCYGTFGGMGLAQLYDANDDQKDRYLYPALRGEKRGFFGLTEPSGGSDPARAIQTRAVQDGDDWVINGQKIFISGADRADFGLVFARTSPEKGRAGVTCFLVDTDMPGFHVRRIVHTLRSTNYATELQFENLRVPAENVLGQVDGGFAIANERLTRNRIPYAASCLGVAMRAQEMAIEYVKIRETFGDFLATRQTIQNMIIDNEMDIQTARWLTLFAAHKADQGEPFRTEAAMAKIAATEAGGRVVDRVMQIHGGYGVTKEFPFERWYREMRIRRIGEGPNEVQRLIIARDLIGGSFH